MANLISTALRAGIDPKSAPIPHELPDQVRTAPSAASEGARHDRAEPPHPTLDSSDPVSPQDEGEKTPMPAHNSQLQEQLQRLVDQAREPADGPVTLDLVYPSANTTQTEDSGRG